jgi:hypothetical protein
MGMGGVYREVVRPERIERSGKTTVTTTVPYALREIRDAVLESPMERGVAESYDKLAELLASTPVSWDSSRL